MKDEVPQTGFGSRKRTLPVTVVHDWMGSSEIHGGDEVMIGFTITSFLVVLIGSFELIGP